MTESHRMRGGALGALLTLIAVVIVAVVVFLAVDVFLFDSATVKRVRGDSSSLFTEQTQADSLSAADAVRIGREEAEKVAASAARDMARQMARGEIARKTGDNVEQATIRMTQAPALSELSGTTQLAAREAKRVAERIAREIAANVATDELMAYVDAVTGVAEPTPQLVDGQTEAVDSPAGDTPAGETADADSEDAQADDMTAQAPSDTPRPESGTDANAAAANPEEIATASTPASASAPAPSEQTAPRSAPRRPAAPAPQPKPQPSAVDLKPWWPTTAVSDQVLSLRFAGEAQADDAGLALLFTAPPASLDAVSDHVRVLDDQGRSVTIRWSTARNPALVQSQSLPIGRYVVIISEELTARDGRPMVRKLEGPVFIGG
ncbi:MAG: hypothetical protein VX549_10225 [Pseudomonadota bacterium]|nr:hypothetical protein [Pseudomonadota bacterium]